MTTLNAILAATLVGAMLGLLVALWAGISMLAGLGGGALIGLILGFGFMSLPPMDKEPQDLFPKD
ncbi:MAG: hypothetical protein HXY22_04605 [Alphaproteobacteria bacterium]|nr:hypothetical protein [Alphaproteobacteria bacterium]